MGGDHLNPTYPFLLISPGSSILCSSSGTVPARHVNSFPSPRPRLLSLLKKVRRKPFFVCQNLQYRKHVRKPYHPASSVSFLTDCRPYAYQMSILSKVILMELFRDFTISEFPPSNIHDSAYWSRILCPSFSCLCPKFFKGSMGILLRFQCFPDLNLYLYLPI